MPPQRTPLQPKNNNLNYGKELSLYMHGRIIGYFENGVSQNKISQDLKLPHSTVRSTIQLDQLYKEGKSQP